MLLYNWLSAMYWTPGPDNSNLINTEKAVPTKSANNAYIKYNTPISLAFEDKNHLSNHILIEDVFILGLLNLYVRDNIESFCLLISSTESVVVHERIYLTKT